MKTSSSSHCLAALLLAALLLAAFPGAASAADDGGGGRRSSLYYVQTGAGINAACDRFTTGGGRLIGITPAVDLVAGINPLDGLGVRLGYQGFSARLRGEGTFSYSYLHADICCNITDMRRVRCGRFIARPYVEAGVALTGRSSFGLGIGAVLGCRINGRLDLVLDCRATRFARGDALVRGTRRCGDGSATVCLVYNF